MSVTAQALTDDQINQMSRNQLKEVCASQSWFHAIDFGDFQSSGRFKPGTPQNGTLYPAFDVLRSMDLSGSDCLDIGCSDGILSFGMASLGAKSVTSVDTYRQQTHAVARKLLGMNTNYMPGLQIKDLLEKFGEKSFDVICCCGVIYHMLNPMSAFIVARKLLREGGVLILESAYSPAFDDAFLVMNTEAKKPLEELYTYWTPSKRAGVGMMKLVGFDMLSVQTIKAPERLTLVGQAVHPNEVKNRQEILQKVHGVDTCDFEFRFSQIKDLGVRTAVVKIPQLPEDRAFDLKNHTPDWPYHPNVMSAPVGHTRWVSESKNYA